MKNRNYLKGNMKIFWLLLIIFIGSGIFSADIYALDDFTDDPIQAKVTVVKAIHIRELRDTINELRTAHGLETYNFTDSGLNAGGVVKTIHILELRDALNGVYDDLGQARPSYTDPDLSKGMVIKADHINELRQAFRMVARQVTTGIWYSTWYAKEGAYIWREGHGAGSDTQLLGDVNGDGKADAVVYFSNDGAWYAALSNGNGFDQYNLWVSGHGVGSSRQFLKDVNGDGKADAVVYFSNDGAWYVALSNGNGFNQYNQWASGHGVGSTNQLMGDVNGDGRNDAIVYFENFGEEHGKWYAALSEGDHFGGFSAWATGHGLNSNNQLLGDVNGDGRDDAVVFFNQFNGDGGVWFAALSNGSGFDSYNSNPWGIGHGQGSNRQILGDMDGDGKDDAIVYFNEGNWYAATSTGQNFNKYFQWKVDHRGESTWQGLGDVYGTNKMAPVVFNRADGSWRVMPADRFMTPNTLNTWEAWNIFYRPRTLGVYQTYDSSDPSVIDEHLAMIADAGIDFLLFDETNNLDVNEGYIKARALAVCGRIAAWNTDLSHRRLRYAIAVGGIQFNNNPETFETEAGMVWDQFVNNPSCGGPSTYMNEEGKPLLIFYSGSYGQRLTWENWQGDKQRSGNFIVRFGQGKVPNGGTPPQEDYGLYYGWGYPQGSLANPDVMVVMPGWNNKHGEFVSRSYNGVWGDFYRLMGWERVHQQKPRMIIINSFNEYSEETAVAPADTSLLKSPSEPWINTQGQLSPDMYWDMTKTYNRNIW